MILLHFDGFSYSCRFNFVWTVDGKISIDEVEAEEVDVRAEFSCPYCYEEFDASALCVHIEDEHCFESKVAVSIINRALLCLQNLTWLAIKANLITLIYHEGILKNEQPIVSHSSSSTSYNQCHYWQIYHFK